MKAVVFLAPVPALDPPLLALCRREKTRPPPSLSSTTPTLSVVVVNYRRWGDTARLVRQLRASRSLRAGAGEVLVVDNHSPPHPLASRLRRLRGVSLRCWSRNRGFARAVNEGVRLGRGRWVLLLNPDMTVADGFLDDVLALADRLDRDEPRAGIVGLGVRNGDGSRQGSTGPFPTLLSTLGRLLLPRAWRKYHLREPGQGGPVPWVTGCCLLVRRQVLDELGGLDPDFFLYYEDVDLCLRARARGWVVRYEPSPEAVHHRPLHARPVPPHLRLLTRHALLIYTRKHWPRWQAWLLARLVQAEAWLRRRRAHHHGDAESAHIFGQLEHLAGELRAGEITAARRRLERVVERWERGQQSKARAGRRESIPVAEEPGVSLTSDIR